MNGKNVFGSRKIRILLVDTLAALLMLLLPRLLAPDMAETWLQVWAIMQPVVVALVLGIAWEDNGALRAGTHPSQREGK